MIFELTHRSRSFSPRSFSFLVSLNCFSSGILSACFSPFITCSVRVSFNISFSYMLFIPVTLFGVVPKDVPVSKRNNSVSFLYSWSYLLPYELYSTTHRLSKVVLLNYALTSTRCLHCACLMAYYYKYCTV